MFFSDIMECMDGFEKIDLGNPNATQSKITSSRTMKETRDVKDVNPQVISMRKRSKRSFPKKTAGWIIGIVAVILLFVIFGVVLPGLKLVSSAKSTYAQAKLAIAAAKKQDVESAGTELEKTKTALLGTQKNFDSMGYLRFIPPFNLYYSDGDHLIKAGLAALDGGKILVDSVAPYADVLGLKGQGSFVGGSAQQRIQTAVTTLSKITPNIDKLSSSLSTVRNELDQVNPNHYPPLFGGDKVKTILAEAKTFADDADTFVKEATPLIKVLPAELGEPTEKKYLIIFQNDKELRPTGGFMTAYAIMRLDHGVIHPDTSDDIYNLDATIANKPVAPRPILSYLAKVPLLNLRDTNLSPDFITSMDLFNSLYAKAGGYRKVDGIIAIDTYPLLDAIDILGGEIDVDGTQFTTKNDSRCNCAQVIYQLEAITDQPVNYVKTGNRKGIVGDLMLAIMNKAFSSSPKLYWGPLFQAMLTNIAQKHIMFDVYNADAQSGIEALNAAGQIRPFDGDYLHINEANFGGDKANLFTTEAVNQDYQIKSDGSIAKTVTINYKNPFPPSDCNLERGGLCLNSLFRDWIRIYVPKGSQIISSKGSEVKLTSYEELGKTVFEGFLTVRPQGTSTFVITYSLPFKLASDSKLPAMYQKQPGTNNNMYTVSVNGHQEQNFELTEDKVVTLTK